MTYAQELKNGCGIAKADPYGKIKGVILCGRDEELCHECKAKAIGYKKAIESELEFLEFPAYCVAGADCCKKICQDRITYLKNELKLLEDLKNAE